MWKCKECGESEFYEYGYGNFQYSTTIDGHEMRKSEYDCNPDDTYPNSYSCANCGESGDCLEDIANWEEEK